MAVSIKIQKNYLKKIKPYCFGDFNINLLNYDTRPPPNEFLVSLLSQYLLLHIVQPTRVKSNSKTLINNIFSNYGSNIVSGNLTASISDHLPQFFVAPDIFFNSSYPKSNKYERDCSRFSQENVVLDYFSVDRDKVLLASNMSNDVLYKIFLIRLSLCLKLMHL